MTLWLTTRYFPVAIPIWPWLEISRSAQAGSSLSTPVIKAANHRPFLIYHFAIQDITQSPAAALLYLRPSSRDGRQASNGWRAFV
jgi:hypothetical protein